MKYFFTFCLLFSLNSQEILWSRKLVSLIEEEGLVAIALNREAPLEELTDEEKTDLERTASKMQSVFQQVYGFGDFARWMPLGEGKLTSYLLPIGAYSGPNEVDYDVKIRSLLFALKERKDLFPPLSCEEIKAIQTAAAHILPHPQADIILQEGHFTCTKIVQGLGHALRELGQNSSLEQEPPPFNLAFTTNCKVFCNEERLEKQHIFASPFNQILYNYRPYVDYHLMIVPNRHITTLSESTDLEILDKYKMLSKINAIARTQFRCPKVGVLTRIGWRAGQTQSHLHDHVIGYDPEIEQPWIYNWISELTGNINQIDETKWETTRAAIRDSID